MSCMFISPSSFMQVSGPAAGLFTSQYEVIANNSGVYKCKMEVMYPPPYKEDCHSTEVVVAGKMQNQ